MLCSDEDVEVDAGPVASLAADPPRHPPPPVSALATGTLQCPRVSTSAAADQSVAEASLQVVQSVSSSTAGVLVIQPVWDDQHWTSTDLSVVQPLFKSSTNASADLPLSPSATDQTMLVSADGLSLVQPVWIDPDWTSAVDHSVLVATGGLVTSQPVVAGTQFISSPSRATVINTPNVAIVNSDVRTSVRNDVKSLEVVSLLNPDSYIRKGLEPPKTYPAVTMLASPEIQGIDPETMVMCKLEEDQLESTSNTVETETELESEHRISCRKRLRNEEKWIRTKRRKLLNSGQQYVATNGKVIPAKTFNGRPKQCCIKNCYSQLSDDECRTLFEKYWKTGDYNVQSHFIADCVSQAPAASHRTFCQPSVRAPRNNRSNFKKTFSRKYTLPVADRRINVCTTLFKAVLCISSSRINTVLEKQRKNGGVPAVDSRGRFDHSMLRIPPEALLSAEAHIRSFPVYRSHLTCSHSMNRTYLSSGLTLPKMYEMYVQWCKEAGIDPVKMWAYRNVFNTRFSLSFNSTHSDRETCKKCDVVGTDQDVVTNQALKADHVLRQHKAKAVSLCLNNKQQTGKSDTFSFDFQKVMPLPRLSANEVHYCRRLSVYNLGIHSVTTGNVIMHVWDETVASQGAEEIASCLLNYCTDKASTGITEINAFDSMCRDQNQNRKIVLMWMHICSITPIEVINHKFMISGHGCLPNDADFRIVKRATSRSSDIYIPDQWCTIIKKCSRIKRFRVVQMQPHMFKSVEELDKHVTVSEAAEDGSKVDWPKIRWIQIRHFEPLKMYYKYTLEDEAPFCCVNFIANEGTVWPSTSLGLLHPQQPRCLSSEKVKDLKRLLKYIPPVHHDFYTRLEMKSVGGITHECDDERPGLNTSEGEFSISRADAEANAGISKHCRKLRSNGPPGVTPAATDSDRHVTSSDNSRKLRSKKPPKR